MSEHLDENLLVDLTSGRLGADERVRAERHVDGCSSCRELVAAWVRADVDPTLPSVPVPVPAPTALHRGDTVGRYVVTDRLGSGGMGVVYAAFDPQLNRKVCLKLLRPDVAGGDNAAESRARLLREAQAMARLSHPNVTAVYDVGTFGEQVFVAVEYIDGATLASWLHQRRPWKEVVETFILAGRGLAAAHVARLVHRDFKPQNVLVGRDGRVLVTDFGLARPTAAGMTPQVPLSKEDLARARAGLHWTGPITQTGTLVGTPAYMAPEQLQGKMSDERTDQFSFCVALYEALYGVRPFHAETIDGLAVAAGLGLVQAPPPSSEVPDWLRQVLLRGLSAEPEGRYPSMDALLDGLARKPQRRRARRSLALGAVASLPLVALGAWWSLRPADPCRAGQARLAGAWDEASLDAMRSAFEATGLPYARASFQTVERLLPARALAFAEQSVRLCREAAPPEQRACSEHHLERLSALAYQLRVANAAAVERAATVAARWDADRACPTGLPMPDAPATARKVRVVRRALAEAEALAALGRLGAARATAQTALDDARGTGYSPVVAEVEVELADLEALEQRPTAEEQLGRAVATARASGHRPAELRARTELARLLLSRGEAVAADVQLAVGLEGADRERHFAPVWEARSLRAEAARARGDAAKAVEEHRAILALQQQVLGTEHPWLVAGLTHLGNALRARGAVDEAEKAYQRALELNLSALGREHPRVVRLSTSLGLYELEQGKPDVARGLLEGVIAVGTGSAAPDRTQLGRARFALARQEAKEGRRDRAVELASQAAEDLEAAGSALDLLDLKRWLTALP